MKYLFNNHNSINWKWPILWIFIHFASLFLLTLVIQQLSLTNNLIIIFLLGFGITIISRIVKTFTLKKSFVVDKWFFFWSLINTFTIWLVLLLTNLLQMISQLLTLLLIAIGLVIVAYFIKRLRITNTNMVITSVILIIIIFIFNLGAFSINEESKKVIDVQNTSVASNGVLSQIKNTIKNLFYPTSTYKCPQMNVSMLEGLWLSIPHETYEGWSIESENGLGVTCRAGNKEGENIKYYYCGGIESVFGMGRINAYIEKTIISNDGSIGKTYRYIIWNIYDENKKFVETRCIDYPDNLEQKRAEALEKEMLKWN